MARYRHTQIGWVTLASLLAGVVLVGGIGLAAQMAVFAVPAAILALVGLLFASMTVELDDQALKFHFGPGLIRKRIALERIRHWAPVSNPWYYGWGIHYIPGGLLYNVSGFEAVELVLDDGERIRVGTDEPQALCNALVARKGAPVPLTGAEQANLKDRSRKGLIVLLVIVFGIMAAVVALLVVQSRPVGLAVEGGALVIDTAFYGDRLPLSQVTSVTLEERLPPIRMRTNGFALGASLRGHFRLDAWGDGRLFVEANRPPFIALRTADSFVIVNATDAAETRRLHEILTQATGERPPPVP